MLQILIGLFIWLVLAPSIFARVTPNDLYQQKLQSYQQSLDKISDPAQKNKVLQATQTLKDINIAVSVRFDSQVNRLAAILEEIKSRAGVNKTVVAYGQGSTALDNAAYWVNYAAEAVAYQKSQDYTPTLGGNLATGFKNSESNLNLDLNILENKILKAKTEVAKVVN